MNLDDHQRYLVGIQTVHLLLESSLSHPLSQLPHKSSTYCLRSKVDGRSIFWHGWEISFFGTVGKSLKGPPLRDFPRGPCCQRSANPKPPEVGQEQGRRVSFQAKLGPLIAASSEERLLPCLLRTQKSRPTSCGTNGRTVYSAVPRRQRADLAITTTSQLFPGYQPLAHSSPRQCPRPAPSRHGKCCTFSHQIGPMNPHRPQVRKVERWGARSRSRAGGVGRPRP
jgi:hypothetical protein